MLLGYETQGRAARSFSRTVLRILAESATRLATHFSTDRSYCQPGHRRERRVHYSERSSPRYRDEPLRDDSRRHATKQGPQKIGPCELRCQPLQRPPSVSPRRRSIKRRRNRVCAPATHSGSRQLEKGSWSTLRALDKTDARP